MASLRNPFFAMLADELRDLLRQCLPGSQVDHFYLAAVYAVSEQQNLEIRRLHIVLLSQSTKSSFLSQPVKWQTMTLLSKHEKRDSRRLPVSANLSESLILSLFLYFFTCFVTVDIPSPHGSRQWLECRNNTETNLPPQYTGTYRLGIQ